MAGSNVEVEEPRVAEGLVKGFFLLVNADLVDLCSNVIFHKNMKAFGLHQLILLYIEWEKTQHEGEETTVEE